MLAFVLGTRPEIIKLSPLILEAKSRNVQTCIIHTGQHYSHQLDQRFFDELTLPQPDHNLHTGSLPPAIQISTMITGLAKIYSELGIDRVMVQGDTNSVLAGALAAWKSNIPVAHLEAGLRSDDWTMPEEGNRVLTDRISTWLFVPTTRQRDRAITEGISSERIHIVGNSIVDATQRFGKQKSLVDSQLQNFDLHKPYVLLTLHRPSNVDDPERLRSLIIAIQNATQTHQLHVVFPVHPRTQSQLTRDDITLPASWTCLAPLGYLDTLTLQRHAKIVMTDSGGIQEEACILRTPSITLRPNTERPETTDIGASVLYSDSDSESLTQLLRERIASLRDWPIPFGNGTTAKQVMDILFV